MPLHVIVENSSAHKHADVKAWLAKDPRVQLHLTPTHASWMNLVESPFCRVKAYRQLPDLARPLERTVGHRPTEHGVPA